MKYFRCRCGSEQAIGTRPPAPCDVCPLCLSTLAESIVDFVAPIPHEFVNECAGPGLQPVVRCAHCHRSMDEIEMAGKVRQSATPA